MIAPNKNDDNIVSLIAFLIDGVPPEDAISACGLSPALVTLWLERGFNEESRINSGMQSRKSELKFYEFFKAFRSAKSQAVVYATRTVKAAFIEDWKAAAWYLEKTNPQNFGKVNIEKMSRELIPKEQEILMPKSMGELND